MAQSNSEDSQFKKIKKGVVKRRRNRVIGVFIDGTSLDRATKRLSKRVDLQNLVDGVSAGSTPVVARYYTLIPHEDDSRQRAFLDAVRRSGLHVIVKRLPPKGITRQVTVETEMASDIIAFGLGENSFEDVGYDLSSAPNGNGDSKPQKDSQDNAPKEHPSSDLPEQRIATVVCPGRNLAYPFSLLSSLQVETVCVDFGQPQGKELMQSASKWIDLSDSETIWKED